MKSIVIYCISHLYYNVLASSDPFIESSKIANTRLRSKRATIGFGRSNLRTECLQETCNKEEFFEAAENYVGREVLKSTFDQTIFDRYYTQCLNNVRGYSNFNAGSFSGVSSPGSASKLQEFCLALYESKTVSVIFRKQGPDDIDEEHETDYENYVGQIKSTGKFSAFSDGELKIAAASLFAREIVKEKRREEQYQFEQGWEQAKVKYRKQIIDSVSCYRSGGSSWSSSGCDCGSRSCYKSFNEEHESVGNWEESRESRYGMDGYETR